MLCSVSHCCIQHALLGDSFEKPSVVIGTVSVPVRHVLSVCCIQHALLGDSFEKPSFE